MHVLGHDNISTNEESVLLAHSFQRLLECPASCGSRKLLLPPMAAKGNEVQVAGLLKALQSPGHGRSLPITSKVKTPTQAELGWGTHFSISEHHRTKRLRGPPAFILTLESSDVLIVVCFDFKTRIR